MLADASLALERLDGIASILPTPDLFVGMYVKKEAVFSSQIEGTRASLADTHGSLSGRKSGYRIC